ncbi:hypothetical protein F53441_1680 [Fusarium austroafricanum]|uniref:Uncharacterized protein n=1 Tax=Fusarium austroafricanum TaxID=2364996 RepID=A0A8H4KTY7_9HYPO|nr:hypothetical protein F53441_1680 [Fusarium austroafricanum]
MRLLWLDSVKSSTQSSYDHIKLPLLSQTPKSPDPILDVINLFARTFATRLILHNLATLRPSLFINFPLLLDRLAYARSLSAVAFLVYDRLFRNASTPFRTAQLDEPELDMVPFYQNPRVLFLQVSLSSTFTIGNLISLSN